MIKIVIITLTLCGSLFTSLSVVANELENKIFDTHQVDPIELLHDEYQRSQVLLIGFALHEHHQHIDQLSKLIERIGTDQRLKYIVLERAHDISRFYELLSTHDLNSTLLQFEFANDEARERSLCHDEWAYTIAHFFPKLRAINQSRLNRPILVKSIDAIPSTKGENWPGPGKPMRDGTCRQDQTATFFSISSTREEETAKRFHSDIVKNLGLNEKAIVLYNQNHLIDNFKLCMPTMISENEWVANMSPLTWISRYFSTFPEARKRMGLILIDESIRNGWISTFEFSKRQMLRKPGQDGAAPLAPFLGVLNETGLDLLETNSNARRYLEMFGGQALNQKTLPELAKGIIINANAHVLYENSPGSVYLPKYCSE